MLLGKMRARPGREAGEHRATREQGFTLVELAVVTIIISILASIAIPLFLRQRDKGYVAQVQSALANAKLIAEAYYTGNDSSYTDLEDNIDGEGLPVELIAGEWWLGDILLEVDSTDQTYCITAIHFSVSGGDWQTATVDEGSGGPSTANTCD